MIILDLGSANSCRNDLAIVEQMIREIAQIDSHKQDVVIKWQLFNSLGKNVPLLRQVYAEACRIARGYGYDTTSSVFDIPSLDFLLKMHYESGYEVPFIKIANNKEAYKLIERIPEDIRVIKSVGDVDSFGLDCMCCVSKYPAKKEQYEKTFKAEQLSLGISDHTTDLALYNKYHPELFEIHFCLDNAVGLDSGPFSRRPSQLKEIL